jgi:ribosomal protein L29
MKAKELRKKSNEELLEILREKKLELLKWEGRRRLGLGYDKIWHPPFKETRKTIARILTILNEMGENKWKIKKIKQ